MVRPAPERPPRWRRRRGLEPRRGDGPRLHGLLPRPPAAPGGGGRGEALHEVEDAQFLHPRHVLPDPGLPLRLVPARRLRLRRVQRGHRAVRRIGGVLRRPPLRVRRWR
jgi:hypothetical protein